MKRFPLSLRLALNTFTLLCVVVLAVDFSCALANRLMHGYGWLEAIVIGVGLYVFAVMGWCLLAAIRHDLQTLQVKVQSTTAYTRASVRVWELRARLARWVGGKSLELDESWAYNEGYDHGRADGYRDRCDAEDAEEEKKEAEEEISSYW